MTFDEAQWVFEDDHAVTEYDEHHSRSEDRWVTLGLSFGTLLLVVHTDEPDEIRIISARRATAHETRCYNSHRDG